MVKSNNDPLIWIDAVALQFSWSKKEYPQKKDNLQEYIPHLKAETTMLENKDFHFLSQEILNIMVV